jgi:probable HAF family extracellular repeat protein
MCRWISPARAFKYFAIVCGTLVYTINSTAATLYRAVPLGWLDSDNYSYASAINGNGAIAGSGSREAFLFSNGGMINVGGLGGLSSIASDINDSDVVVGYALNAAGVMQAFSYKNGQIEKLLPSSEIESTARSINNQGTIVGSVGQQIDGSAAIFLGIDQTVGIDSRARWGAAINNSGQIVGDRAFIFSNSVVSYFNSPSDFLFPDIYAINSAGLAVGYGVYSGNLRALSFFNGLSIDISQDGLFQQAFGLNDMGQIVGAMKSEGGVSPSGYTAALLDAGQLLDLNTQAIELNGWFLFNAVDINGSGQIAANGWNPTSREYQAFRLDPISDVPTPATFALLGLGVIGVASASRRQS